MRRQSSGARVTFGGFYSEARCKLGPVRSRYYPEPPYREVPRRRWEVTGRGSFWEVGAVDYCEMKSPMTGLYYDCNPARAVTNVHCVSKNHRLILTRR